MISLDLMKSSEVWKVGDQSNNRVKQKHVLEFRMKYSTDKINS